MKKIKAVIFDQDGLMFDTEIHHAMAWKKAAKEMNFVLDEGFLSRNRGRTAAESKQFFQEYYGNDDIYDEMRSKKSKLYEEDIRTNGLPIKKGLKELLEYLKENGYKIALATASREDWSKDNLCIAGVEKYFDYCVFGNQVKHCKPDPEIFLRAAEGLNEKPENCLVLEDSLNGIEAAISGGFHRIMVPDLTEPSPELEQQLTAKCDDLIQVREWIKKYN